MLTVGWKTGCGVGFREINSVPGKSRAWNATGKRELIPLVPFRP